MQPIIEICGLVLTIYGVVTLADKLDVNYVEAKTKQESRNLPTNTVQPVSLGQSSHEQKGTTEASETRGEK